jgi:branched-chain amino acid transport system ATP-binding protein
MARVLDFLDMTKVQHLTGAMLKPFQARLTEIGKCLVASPRLVLLDEPGGGLAEAQTAVLRRVIPAIHREFGAQVLLRATFFYLGQTVPAAICVARTRK